MKIYIAHNFAAREILKHLIPEINQLGHEVTSRWIWDDSHCDGGHSRKESAEADLEDINKADALIFITNQYGPRPGKGKFLELGYALAKGKRCFLVGTDCSSVFYFLDQMESVRVLKNGIQLMMILSNAYEVKNDRI